MADGQVTGRATAKIVLDSAGVVRDSKVIIGAGKDMAKVLAAASKELVAARKVELAQIQQIATAQRQELAQVQGLQTRLTAAVKTESQIRVATTKIESVQKQQAYRQETIAFAEAEKRKTADHYAGIRARERAERSALSGGNPLGGAVGAALGSIGGPIGAVAGAVGGGGGVAGAVGIGAVLAAKAAVEGEKLATSYARQSVAALSLAGSQGKLNELLDAYNEATGGAVGKAQAMADVTRLQAIGFAKSAAELKQFVTAARGISLATGQDQEYVISQLQLAIANKSTLRLDQLGLGVAEVEERISALRAANKGLTEEQAYQQGVLGLATEKFGALTTSVEGQATGVERLAVAWGDLGLAMAKAAKGPTDSLGGYLAARVNELTAAIEQEGQDYQRRTGEIYGYKISPHYQNVIDPKNRYNDPVASPMRPSATAPLYNDDQTAALRKRDEGFAAIERESGQARLEETRSFQRQQASIVANYNKQVTREAEDFARQRANQERKLQFAILDVAQDSARQRVKWEADLERTLNEARADRDKRIAELRADSAERVAEIDEKFAKSQEKRASDHADRLRDAAANLDAVAVREEQKRYRDENQEAKEAHEEQISDAQKSLQKGIDDQNEAFAEQEKDQRDSLARRIEEQKENDRLRIEEMKAAFEEQKTQEDIERGIRLDRQAEDHDAQLIELGRQHEERIQQIKDEAQKEREQFTEESNKFLEDVGIHNQAWLDEQKVINDGVIKRHEELLEAQRRALLTPGHASLADPYVDRTAPEGSFLTPAANAGGGSNNNSRSTSIVIQSGAMVIQTLPGQDKEEIGAYVLEVMADFLEDYNDQ